MIKLLLFSIIMMIIVILLLIIVNKYVVEEKNQNILFIITSLLTVIIHYLPFIVSLFKGKILTDNIYYLPVYPCNVIMWLNIIMCFFIKKKNVVFQTLADFSFFCGTICGLIGLFLNENFLNNPIFLDLINIKGLFSHVVMIFTCLSIGVFKWIKVNTLRNTIHLLIGCFIFVICHLYTNLILKLRGLEKVDAFYINKMFEKGAYLNFFTISLLGLIIIIVGTKIYEKIKLRGEK